MTTPPNDAKRYLHDGKKRLIKRPSPNDVDRIISYRTEVCVAYNAAVEDGAPDEVVDYLKAEYRWSLRELMSSELKDAIARSSVYRGSADIVRVHRGNLKDTIERSSAGSGYVPCACRDCMEIAIGQPGVALCHDCEEAGCGDNPHWPDCECEASVYAALEEMHENGVLVDVEGGEDA